MKQPNCKTKATKHSQVSRIFSNHSLIDSVARFQGETKTRLKRAGFFLEQWNFPEKTKHKNSTPLEVNLNCVLCPLTIYHTTLGWFPTPSHSDYKNHHHFDLQPSPLCTTLTFNVPNEGGSCHPNYLYLSMMVF